jgi:hypothetical protein
MRLRNLRNLHLLWLNSRTNRVVTLVAFFPIEFALVELPQIRIPFLLFISTVIAWVLVTLLRSNVTVNNDQLRYRSWLGVRSVSLEEARSGILVRRGNRLTILGSPRRNDALATAGTPNGGRVVRTTPNRSL